MATTTSASTKGIAGVCRIGQRSGSSASDEKKYPMTPLNVIDLLLVLFCGITLIVTFTSPCSDGSMCELISLNHICMRLGERRPRDTATQ